MMAYHFQGAKLYDCLNGGSLNEVLRYKVSNLDGGFPVAGSH
jgi:hypothetical protein